MWPGSPVARHRMNAPSKVTNTWSARASASRSESGGSAAHPTHIEPGLADAPTQLQRIAVVRANASQLSHAELDEADELDDGDPVALAAAVTQLRDRLPGLRVIGGCCGTDVRHVAAMWGLSA